MWKCVSRSLRTTFKKNAFRCSTVLSTNAHQNKTLCFLKYTPARLETCNRYCNLYGNTPENSTKEKNDREGPKKKRISFLGKLHDFVEFLKLSGFFFLAAYFSEHNERKKSYNYYNFTRKQPLQNRIGNHKSLKYLINVLGVSPYSCFRPEVQGARSISSQASLTESPPLEPEDDNFSRLKSAHQVVLGTLSNWLGNQCMQKGKHKEALEYFIQSAKEEYAPGIFNLGICHERGYGTSQNFTKAAEMYQRAANLGHPTAMYNLGVFYAQGVGEIQLDLDRARDLFKMAAGLGQADAAKALKKEKLNNEEFPESALASKEKEKDGDTLVELTFDNVLNQSSSSHFNECDDVVKNCCDSFEFAKEKEIISSTDSDSGVVDLSPHNDPYDLLV